jgi:hypothetical protein
VKEGREEGGRKEGSLGLHSNEIPRGFPYTNKVKSLALTLLPIGQPSRDEQK